MSKDHLQKCQDTPWACISGGVTHTVAVKTDGSLYSWGSGLQGQLGATIEEINGLKKQYLDMWESAPPKKQPGKEQEPAMALKPTSYEYDENAIVNSKMIQDRNIWLPCVPMPYLLKVSEKIKFK